VSGAAVAPEQRLALRGHGVGALRTAVYLLLALPLGVLHLLALLPVGLLSPAGLWRLAELERKLANRLLDAHIPPLPYRRMEIVSRPPRGVLALLLLRLPATVPVAVAAVLPLALTFELVRYGVEGVWGTSDRYLGPWPLGPVVGAFLWLFALAAAVVSVAVLDELRAPLRALVARLLASAPTAAVAVREALAERIGDRTLAIAYWLPERSAFVDERGLPVELPEPGSGRAWTEVAHEGRRVAAIVHGAELDARPELVRAAASGAVLALDNERLKADLRARIEELRTSRTRIVEAALEARRRIERDLHDGAQQQLVALSLDLRMLKARLASDPASAELVDASLEKLAAALDELRELARGIHPAILTDRGLPAALDALVGRIPLPVDCAVSVEERVAPAVEAAAYFVVAEALTNVVKYAHASRARVTVRRIGDRLEVEVADDGLGGADPREGSGLRGLEDRVAAVDGALEVHSPRGEGTRVVARLPVSPPALVSGRPAAS
jgi:signal transduction histidine kinase